MGSTGVPGAQKNWKTYEGLPVLSMAQAGAMDYRLDLERSADGYNIVRLPGTSEKKENPTFRTALGTRRVGGACFSTHALEKLVG